MNLRKKAKDALENVSATSARVGESAQWATIAMAAVTLVAVVALMYATAAVREVRR